MNNTSLLPTALPSADDDDYTIQIEDLVVFEISAGVLAIACFGVNVAMGAAALYSRHPRTTHRSKTTIFISQAASGLLSPFSFIYPCELMKLRFTNHPPQATLDFLTNYSSCFTTSTIPIIISTMSPVAHTFLLTLDLYLPLIDCQLAWQHWALLCGIIWFMILLIAFFPTFNWNTWNGLCYLPSSWTPNYFGMIGLLIILQVMACVYMLLGAFIRSRVGKEPLTEEVILRKELLPRVPSWEAKSCFACLLILLFCDLPLLLHILVHCEMVISTSSNYLPPLLQVAVLARHDSVLPWTILISMFSTALLPPLTIAADPILSSSLVIIYQRLSCWKQRYMRAGRQTRRQRNNAVGPTSDWDRGIPP